jgi:Sec-independent protein secretion pathway component TatC
VSASPEETVVEVILISLAVAVLVAILVVLPVWGILLFRPTREIDHRGD